MADRNPLPSDRERRPSGRKPSLAAHLSHMASEAYSSDAIDDTEDADEGEVEAQMQTTQTRIVLHNSAERLLHKVIPFHWAPMLQPLTERDTDTAVTLHNAAFANGDQSISPDLINYFITKCEGLCYGLFNSCRPDDAKDWHIQTLPSSRDVETGRADGAKHVMFAHIIASLGDAPVITDEDLTSPTQQDDRQSGNEQNPRVGHKFWGRTICLHSVAVCSEVQGIGVGKTMLKSFIEYMRDSRIADRIALICKQPQAIYWERCGFNMVGNSKTTRMGSGWQDLVLDLRKPVSDQSK